MPNDDKTEPVSKSLRDAAVVVVAAALLGFIVNALRPSGSIPFIQSKPYDIVVPCPEPVGEARSIEPNDPRLVAATSLVVDAQSSANYAVYHLPQAINIPFDWLGPPVQNEVKDVAQRVARSQAKQVIVYGDGDDPDSGREWARLLAGGGLRNVFFVVGGVAALRARPSSPSAVTPLTGTP